jgi:hypothetical protein
MDGERLGGRRDGVRGAQQSFIEGEPGLHGLIVEVLRRNQIQGVVGVEDNSDLVSVAPFDYFYGIGIVGPIKHEDVRSLVRAGLVGEDLDGVPALA